jgi:hypothetical protein
LSTNFYFNNFNNSQEQVLIESLVMESIKIYGHDVFYCPRTLVAKDDIYGEDALSEYNNNYEIDMYIKSYDSYEGDGTFLSKFNLEIRDQMTMTISVRNYNDEIGQYEGLDRPQEGDLIYIPMVDRLLIIKYVSKTPVFYQMGAIQMYDLVCEIFEYSSERLNTGIEAIDKIEQKNSIAMETYGLLTTDGFAITTRDGFQIIQSGYDFQTQAGDAFEDNTEIELEADAILDWTQIDPFSEGTA